METLQSLWENELQNPLIHEIAHLYRELVPSQAQWDIGRSTDVAKLWLVFHQRSAPYVEQGWKLHLAAHPSSAQEVLRRVFPHLLRSAVSFKVVASLEVLSALNQGQHGWSQIGKFITIYPSSEQEAVELAARLDECTYALAGPKIPSDRSLRPGSLVHYRYGSFHGGLFLQEPDGLISPAIRAPTGELLADQRKNVYEAPADRDDPFARAGLLRESPSMRRLLDKRYLLAGVLTASPMHTLYLAGDLQDARSVVLKGPGIVWEQGRVDESILQSLRHEAAILRVLADVEQAPRLYACFEQDAAVFLVLEDIKGETITDYVKHIRNQGMQIKPQQAIDWGKRIAMALEALHKRGLVYVDLKPTNVMVEEDGHLRLIDFELTDLQGSQPREHRGTRGYSSPQRQCGLPLAIADDVYSLGCLLYFIVTGAEPSEAPDSTTLLARPPEWFSPAGALLQGVIRRCLSAATDERYASMGELLADLESLNVGQLEALVSQDEAPAEETRWAQLAQELLQTLCTIVRREPEQPGAFWQSAHPLTYGLAARDLNAGNAGTLLAFAELVSVYPEKAYQSLLAEAARWLRHAPFISGQPLPGLYIGEAGVGAALLRAGQILHDETLIEAACARGRLVASLPYLSPDLFNGTAGRLRFHLWLWDETGEPEHLYHAIACGTHLLETAHHNEHQEVFWTLPEGYRALSGQTYAGYAHGAAGIADALLDLFETTGDKRYLDVVEGAARWLKRLAYMSDGDKEALNWPLRDQEPANAPFWCHGGAGIGQFFLHVSQHTFFPEAEDLAARAARSVAHGTLWANPTQCHGLAGNIEFLLDMYQATGLSSYRAQANALARCLAAFASQHDGLRVFPSEMPTTFTPDYMVGYGGVAVCLLRLCEPEHRPRQLSRAGFRPTHHTSILTGSR